MKTKLERTEQPREGRVNRAGTRNGATQRLAIDAAVPGLEIRDDRPEATSQRRIQESIDTGPRQSAQAEQLKGLFEPYAQGRFDSVAAAAQRKGNSDESINRTGMPDRLKVGLEQLSGIDLSDVRVHKNSSKPAQLNALAYAQGNHIHLGPGQERHLPHEGWHVVQQRQGRVKATRQAFGTPVNDDQELEREADVMGGRAVGAGLNAQESRFESDRPTTPAGPLVQNRTVDGVPDVAVRQPAVDTGLILQKASLEASLAGSFVRNGRHTPSTVAQFHLRDTIRGTLEYKTAMAAIQNAPLNERQEVLTNEPTLTYISEKFLGNQRVTIMSALLEGSQEWKNPTANDFYQYFVTDQGKGKLPNSATMNCWESILYAAYLTKKVSASWIATFYRNALRAPDANIYIWTTLGFNLGLPTYPATTPKAGQLLFYHDSGAIPGHVALSLGGDSAMSLWHSPNDIDTVQRIQVGDLAGTVYIASPPW